MIKSIKLLKEMQYPSGLIMAAISQKTGYHRAWIRDNLYSAIGLECVDMQAAVKVYHALLDILLKHESKIDWAINNKPTERYQYIHARYDPHTLEEIWEEWGNKQNDAIGLFLFKIGDLMEKGIKILRNIDDYRIIQKLVFYLASIEYWKDEDNGMWEENEEIHSSSVGACLAGLKIIQNYVYVPPYLIKNGQDTLNLLLPKESITKEVDLAQLSLIYPFNIVTEEQKQAILKNVEEQLVRNKGVIRYKEDKYYEEQGLEPSWTMGFPWLAIIYKQDNNQKKYLFYRNKTLDVMNDKGELPELYLADTDEYNDNTPLAWSHALYLVMRNV